MGAAAQAAREVEARADVEDPVVAVPEVATARPAEVDPATQAMDRPAVAHHAVKVVHRKDRRPSNHRVHVSGDRFSITNRAASRLRAVCAIGNTAASAYFGGSGDSGDSEGLIGSSMRTSLCDAM